MADVMHQARSFGGGEAIELDEPAPGRGGEEQDGVVVEMLPRALFVVQLESKRQVVAHLSGDPRRNFLRIMTGDRVMVALSPRDRTRGRITSRLSG